MEFVFASHVDEVLKAAIPKVFEKPATTPAAAASA
jgi:hypothetical protein